MLRESSPATLDQTEWNHLSFRLSDDFIRTYEDRTPPFGFDIGGSNTLGELTFLTKYSRTKADGTKERWHECCRRVVEGTYSILKDHCNQHRTPWIAVKAQRAAEDMYDRLWSMKWTPPGRGLWMMGTPFVFAEGSAALQSCFAGETKIITRDGLKRLDDLVGTSPTILTSNGKWTEAPVRSFGVQPLRKITLSRVQGETKVIYATPNHNWYVRDRRQAFRRKGWTAFTTDDLRPGIHQLQDVFGQGIKAIDPSPFGIAHGFAYGDGWRRKNNSESAYVALHGEKDRALIPYFHNCSARFFEDKLGGVEYGGLPNYFKEVPSLAENKAYLYGWVAGYMAADGTVDKIGVVSLASHNRDALEYVREVCNLIGIGTYGIRHEVVTSNIDGKEYDSYKLTFMKSTLSEDFFVITEHRRRWLDNQAEKDHFRWKVESVEETDRVEEVYCATVDESHKFALEDNILTGNCAFLSTEKLGLRNPTFPFVRLMEMSMLGVGVGFDTRGTGKLSIHTPDESDTWTYQVPDTREGWCESVDHLLQSYFLPNHGTVIFDYSLIRPAGIPLKRFGGISSGPAPLQRLHDEIKRLLDGRVEQELDSTTIVDIANQIGRCVVAGSVRRSSEIALGFADDEEFLKLKDWEVNPERNGANGWGHLSNNSVIADSGDNLDHIVDQIALNGEPGVIFIDVMRDYGRLGDSPDYKDHRVAGCNPCHNGNVLMLTKERGMVPIRDLADTSFTLWNGQEWSESTAWHSGVKPTYRVSLSNGQSIDLTEDHRLAVWTEGDEKGRNSVETEMTVSEIASSISSGANPKIRSLLGSPTWDGVTVDEQDAIMCGLLLGDGYAGGSGRSTSAYIKTQEPEVLEFLRSVDDGTFDIREPQDGVTQTSCLTDWTKRARSFGIDLYTNLPDRAFPESVMQWSPSSQKALLRGLFSANGGAMPRHARIDLKTTCRELAGQVQTMLLALGFCSYITTNKPYEIEWDNGIYESRESYDVNIAGRAQYEAFQDEIGFLHLHKSVRLDSEIKPRQPRCARVVSVTPLGTEDVYDFTEPLTHWGWANGFKSHNCGEIELESNELCTLSETFPMNHETLADYLKTLKVAYLYGKAVTLLPTHWPETNEVMSRNRRVGTSMSGIATFVEKRGWGELREWCDAGYAELKRRDHQFSEWLGVRESIKISTVKPSGTVSLLSNSTPGVHWPVAGSKYFRRVRYRKDDVIVPVLEQAGYHIEPSASDPDVDVVATFPTTGPDVRGERDVSVWEKVSLAALMQRHWSDNMVSATFSFQPHEIGEVGPTIRSFAGQMKSMSFLPMGEELSAGAYPQMPYQKVSDEEFDALRSQIKPLDMDALYASGREAEGEKFCSTDVCEIKL